MRPVDGKGSYHYESTQDHNFGTNASNFELQNGNKPLRRHKTLGSRTKPTPSKWDDAQKWLVGLSGGEHKQAASKPRNSNADDRRLLTSLSQRGRDSYSSADGDDIVLAIAAQEEGETKKIDYWGASKPAVEDAAVAVRSICLRDTGTEMTPIASKEPSRTGTPLRATTPVLKSPISSRSSTPGRVRPGGQQPEGHQAAAGATATRSGERRSDVVPYGRSNGSGGARALRAEAEIDGDKSGEVNAAAEQERNPNSLESRAVAWDEAERAKFMARYKREEVKIQAWENHEKRKAELEMRRMEVKAERIKSRAQERYANKLAAARRVAEEKRANAEAKLNERAARTTEKADFIRRTGHLPSFFSFKLPSLCN
ncbi:uncharacterized protein LOC141832251 [Curcuma longa]|uniref:uncharacterized protein LOC141832251 n=1 Tax=Curcuma longa TaxID=136217 RepID=UPI003D9F2264